MWSVYREYNESYGQEYRTILFAAVDYTAKTAKPEYRQGQCRPGKLCFPRALNHGEPWACVEFMIQKKKKKKKKKTGPQLLTQLFPSGNRLNGNGFSHGYRHY